MDAEKVFAKLQHSFLIKEKKNHQPIAIEGNIFNL